MKLVIDWKPKNLFRSCDFTAYDYELVQQQHMGVESALAEQGVFTLTEAYSHYQDDQQVWTSKTREQRL